MKKFYMITLAAMLFTIFSMPAGAQTEKDYREKPLWVNMMQNPDANFYETVEAFELYWEGREITKGAGWKPFKRWEHFWRQRIDEEGNLPEPDKNWNAYQNYRNTHSRSVDGEWTNLGPIERPDNIGTGQPNGNGRINAVAFHPDDEETFYIGAPAGGFWTTTDGGENWTSNTDDLPSLGVSAIAINPDNPDIMYIGTGDRDAGDALGMGVMKSSDGGETWELFNNSMGEVTVGRLVISEENPETLLAATSYGIYKTTDDGVNWTEKEGGNFKDIVFHPTNEDIIYATKNGDFYRSDDMGESWTEIFDGLPGGNRGTIAVTPAAPDYVYFVLTNQRSFKGLYFSDDAGLSFSEQSTSPNIMTWDCNGNGTGGQAWYNLDIAADPNDPDVIYVGGVNIFKSTDKGKSWNINAHWTGDCGTPAVHADHHTLEYHPLNDRLYSGNDGGIYWTDDGGTDWTEITSGLAISQVYRIGQSATVQDYVINGYQDNGTAVFESSGWTTVMGGDGMDCLIDYSDATYSYGEYYYGSINRMSNNYYEGSIVGGISEEGAWVTPYILHETDPSTMFVGMTNVWRTNNVKEDFTSGIEWQQISNNIGSSKIGALENSPANPDVLYVAKSSQLYRSDDANGESTSFADLSSNIPGSGTVTHIESHPVNENIVYITRGDGVYKSEDKGSNWEDITGTLPEVSMNTIEFYENSQEALYVGSDIGIYYRDASMDDWIEFSEGFPATATVTDIEFYYDSDSVSNDLIRASTYGRGLWESGLYYSDPVADFEATESEIPIDCSVDYSDKSLGIPHEWEWEFEGGTPSTSTERNPAGITYHEEGTYAVTLTVSNPDGEDTKTVTEYITVSGSLLPEPEFNASQTSFCAGDEAVAEFSDESTNCPAEWEWIFEPNTVEFIEGTNSSSPNPVVHFQESGNYDVTLVVTNTSGNNSETKEDYINVGGKMLPFSDDFEQGMAPEGWQVMNDDNQETWEEYNLDGNTAMRMNHYNYGPPGDRDQLISPALDLSGLDNAYITFDHAYAQRHTAITDSLIVYVSGDCGATWNRVFEAGEDGTGNHVTHPQTDESFVPESSEDWCGEGFGADCNEIDISQFTGQNNIKVMFETYNYYNNNFYLDNVKVTNSIMTGIEANDTKDDFSLAVYPNPTKGMINVVGSGFDDDIQIFISSMDGKIIYSENIDNRDSRIDNNFDLSEYPRGMYNVQIIGNSFQKNKRVMLR